MIIIIVLALVEYLSINRSGFTQMGAAKNFLAGVWWVEVV